MKIVSYYLKNNFICSCRAKFFNGFGTMMIHDGFTVSYISDDVMIIRMFNKNNIGIEIIMENNKMTL